MNQLYATTNQVQMITVVWIPRFTATLSSLGSLAIMYMILSTRKDKLTKPSHRLMLALITVDILHSVAYATTTLASPQDTQFYGAMGNNGTCSVQGFLLLLGLAVPMYNTSLSLFFLLTIRYRVRQATFSAKIEPILHTVSILVPLSIAVIALSIGGITSESVVCYLSFEVSSSIAIESLWSVILGIVMICFIINLFSMISISCYVRTQLNSVRRYSFTLNQKERRATEKREVVVQSLYYTGAFFATFFFPVLILAFNKKCFPLEVCFEILYPLQGFWNFLLYTRPSIKRMKKANPDKYWICICWEVIFHANKRDGPFVQNVRNRRDMNIVDVDEMEMVHELATPISTLGNELEIFQTNDSDEMGERDDKCEEFG